MIIISGATGFIGRSVLNQIPKSNVRILTRNTSFSSEIDTCPIDLSDECISWGKVFSGTTTVIHLAAVAHGKAFSDADMIKVNVSSTLRFAREAAKNNVNRFVFVSSIGVNGISTNEMPFTESATPLPHNSYAQSKHDAEIGLKKIAADTGLEVVIIRPTLVYGPEAPGSFGMLTKLVSKLPFLPFGLANNRRDFLAVQNLADLLITCASHPDAAGHTFLASDGETVSIKEFTNAIAAGLGKKVIQLPVPVSLMRLAGQITGKSAMIEQLYGNLEVDSSNIKEVLGWTPPLTMKQAMATLRDSGAK